MDCHHPSRLLWPLGKCTVLCVVVCTVLSPVQRSVLKLMNCSVRVIPYPFPPCTVVLLRLRSTALMCLPVSTNPYFTVYKEYPYFQPYYCISLSVVFLCFTCSTLTLRNIGNSTKENQSSDKSVTSDANPARTFPGNDTGAVTTLSAGLGSSL